ncbi:Phospholipase D [hydrothermal vent metagenome]|uniref:Phospholipase D n=1 Tax=hydrothermal vent metagenome TaxID=652676 RepID=A0A3B0YJG9_9ZZZZ
MSDKTEQPKKPDSKSKKQSDNQSNPKRQKSRVVNCKTTLLANNWFANDNSKNLHKNKTFSKPSKQNKAWFYTDGKEYFSDIYDAITALDSGSSIYITDWGMDIDLYLKKEAKKSKDGKLLIDPKTKQAIHDNKYRLLDVFVAAALRDIRIHIILWDSKIINTQDIRNEAVLESILGNNKKHSNNIRVIRHRPSPIYTHHQKTVTLINPKTNEVTSYLGGLDLYHGRWDTNEHRLADPHSKFFPGAEYSNPLHVGQFSREVHPRMPWHDVHMGVKGPAAREVERNFVRRWNYLKDPFHWDKADNEWETHLEKYVSDFKNKKKDYKYVAVSSKEKATVKLSDFKLKESGGNQTVQILRTMYTLNAGAGSNETNIYEVFKKMIKHSKHYVYIETQYLASNYGGNSRNQIMKCLVDRIMKAYNTNKKRKAAGKPEINFRVYIVFPVTPDGNYDEGTMWENMYWQWRNIHRMGSNIPQVNDLYDKFGGMYAELAKQMGKKVSLNPPKITGEGKTATNDWKPGKGFQEIAKYLKIFNLRAYDTLTSEYGNKTLLTEQIYVHAKIMIVDDRAAVIGTANINDRSLIHRSGDSDTEIAALVVDNDTEIATIDGKPACVRKFARNLRLQLWSEHLGVSRSSEDIADPVSDRTHKFISDRAFANTELFNLVFPGIPGNDYPTFESMIEAEKKRKVENSAVNTKIVKSIKGHIVDFPLVWLWSDDDKVKDYNTYIDYWFAMRMDIKPDLLRKKLKEGLSYDAIAKLQSKKTKDIA